MIETSVYHVNIDTYSIDEPISLPVQKILNPAGESNDEKGVSEEGQRRGGGQECFTPEKPCRGNRK